MVVKNEFEQNEIQKLLKAANIGWWKADFKQEVYICSDFIQDLLGLKSDLLPPTDDNSILNGGAWTRFNTSDPGFYLIYGYTFTSREQLFYGFFLSFGIELRINPVKHLGNARCITCLLYTSRCV